MTETDPEKRLIGYACISTYGRMLDTQLSRAHLRRRRRSGIGLLTDPTAVAQLWLRAAYGRVEMWRGDGRLGISVSAPFVWRCLTGAALAPFPHPAHRTGRADFPHPALGQGLTPSPTARCARARPGVPGQNGRTGARVDRSRSFVS